MTAPSMLMTPPSSAESSPLMPLPNTARYYSASLHKSQFNLILINCGAHLLKILYGAESSVPETKLRYFMVEVLRRSKTSIQTLQAACWYLLKAIKSGKISDELKANPGLADPRKLFLAFVILASKFNQDYNYSFKSWLRICGVSPDNSFDVQKLRHLEQTALRLVDYQLCLNGAKYENWCNVLLIFGYDFIKSGSTSGPLVWEDDATVVTKLDKWSKFFQGFNLDTLSHTRIDFATFYARKMGHSKSLFAEPAKRCRDDSGMEPATKRCRRSSAAI
ncbi:hypothetical protein DICA1_A09406 [Diutina catenulata]